MPKLAFQRILSSESLTHMCPGLTHVRRCLYSPNVEGTTSWCCFNGSFNCFIKSVGTASLLSSHPSGVWWIIDWSQDKGRTLWCVSQETERVETRGTHASHSYGSHHVHNLEVSKGEDEGVGRCGHRQHEGQAGSHGTGQHHVQRVYLDSCGLIKAPNNGFKYKKQLWVKVCESF